MTASKAYSPISLWPLAWPIFLELLLQTLLGMVDTLMVSRISDGAVAVVGISNQLFGALITLFTAFAGGAGILIAQRMGSGKTEEARELAVQGVSVSLLLGVSVSAVLLAVPDIFGRMLGIPPELKELGGIYIGYAGGSLFLVGLSIALGTAIRNMGNTKGPMYTGVAVNVLHILLNYVFIFGALGFPEMGLPGVALSTGISRVFGVIILLFLFRKSFVPSITPKDFISFDGKLLRGILRIAWPLGINSFSWVFSQLLVYTFLARLGGEALAARTYLNTLESFCFTLGYAIAMAGQIRTAHLFGAGRMREAYTGAYRTMGIGLAVVTANMLVIYLCGRQLLGLFTADEGILKLAYSLLGLNLLLQPAKMINMAIGNSLNAIGDTAYTMATSLISMSLIGVGGAYLAGIALGYGLLGIYLCMIADELVRGILVLWRWRGQRLLRAEATHSADGSRPCGIPSA
ncbi:MATE family efflux transporter [Paenibacillus sp. YN15]|uniref:MATE family efflux transporter n=1 Tax=Paenibacillus sp. YN15 TaxID=1742774 RepID=UPI000DCE9211|nr:MATE family efflux transporter [Paenibacillus sp. YN15]RAV05066.1 MATE family efflux transporter [Paenibacillus sp. YN15]